MVETPLQPGNSNRTPRLVDAEEKKRIIEGLRKNHAALAQLGDYIASTSGRVGPPISQNSVRELHIPAFSTLFKLYVLLLHRKEKKVSEVYPETSNIDSRLRNASLQLLASDGWITLTPPKPSEKQKSMFLIALTEKGVQAIEEALYREYKGLSALVLTLKSIVEL